MTKLEDLKDRLTPMQQMAVHLLVANEFAGKEKRTLEDIAEEIGISRKQLYEWRTENVNFIRYQSALSDAKLDSYRSLVDAKLMALIEKGPSNNGIPSIKAIELYYKLSGRLVERKEVTNVNDEKKTAHLTADEISKGLAELNKMLEK